MDNQITAIATAKAKLSTLGKISPAAKALAANRDFAAEKADLEQFIKLCGSQMIGAKELNSMATEQRLYDFSASLLLQSSTVPNDQLQRKVALQLREWTKELKLIHEGDSLIDELRSGFDKVFGHETSDVHKALKMEVFKSLAPSYWP